MNNMHTELRCHATYQDTVLNEVGDSKRASVKPENMVNHIYNAG